MPNPSNIECTEISARWCPIHGDCICPDEEVYLDDENCPLHSPSSSHGELPGEVMSPSKTSKFNTCDLDEVMCPYCGHQHSDIWELEGGRCQCHDCGREFKLEVQETVTYSTYKIEEE